MNHLGDTNKMVSETPISDSTPHNVADLGMLCRTLERLASVRLDYINQLEANNDAANAKIDRLTAKVAQLYEGAEEQKQRIKRLEEEIMDAKNKHAVLVADVALYEDRGDRIKRLEEAGDKMFPWSERVGQEFWTKAKEAKL